MSTPNRDPGAGEEIRGVDEEPLEHQHGAHRLAMGGVRLGGLVGPGAEGPLAHREGEEAGEALAAAVGEQLGPFAFRQRRVRQRVSGGGGPDERGSP